MEHYSPKSEILIQWRYSSESNVLIKVKTCRIVCGEFIELLVDIHEILDKILQEKNYISIFLLSFQSFYFDNVYMYVLLLCKNCEIKYV